MAPEDLQAAVHHQPFEPFRLLMTDGTGYDILHPDLVMIGKRSAIIGLTGAAGQPCYDQTVKVDLFHVMRLEPIPGVAAPPKNGPS